MRAFIASITVLVVIIAASVINGTHVASVADELICLENMFSDEPSNESSSDPYIRQAEELIDKNYRLFTLVCGSEMIGRLRSALERVKSTFVHGTAADYYTARLSFIDAVTAIKCSERIAFRGII